MQQHNNEQRQFLWLVGSVWLALIGVALAGLLLLASTGRARSEPPSAATTVAAHPTATLSPFRHLPTPVLVPPTNNPAPPGSGLPLPESEIAFVAERNGRHGIHLMQSDGSNIRTLTSSDQRGSFYDELAWSPDGAKLAFLAGPQQGAHDIYVMNTDGSSLRNLTNEPANYSAPSWSPDGQRLAFAAGGANTSDIYVIDASGGTPRNLTRSSDSETAPTWSPDGQQIAFVSGRTGFQRIYLMEADGSNVQRLTQDTAGYFSRPTWSPDGQRIAYKAIRGGQRWYIEVIDTESNLIDTMGFDVAQYVDLDWSPDGQQIAFVSVIGGHREIYRVHFNGANLHRLTDHPARDSHPDWSPDGRFLLFTREEYDGSQALYLMEADGSNPRSLEVAVDANTRPRWRP